MGKRFELKLVKLKRDNKNSSIDDNNRELSN